MKSSPGSQNLSSYSSLGIMVFAHFLFLCSCQGDKSEQPPVMPIQNMVNQTSFGPQFPNQFFADKRAARMPVTNTVAVGDAKIDKPFNTGQTNSSTAQNPLWVNKFPIKLDRNILLQGQQNYNIYCSPCHGLSGHNDGLVTIRAAGSIRPANIHDATIIAKPVGKIYDAVTNGVNNWNMPGFSAQLDTIERWSIVAYVRALQLSEQTQTNTPIKKDQTK